MQPPFNNKQKAIYALALLTNEIDTIQKKLAQIDIETLGKKIGTIGDNIDEQQLKVIESIILKIKQAVLNVTTCNRVPYLKDFKETNFEAGKEITEQKKST